MASASSSKRDRPAAKPLTHAPDVPHLLLTATGSVATIKIPSIISALSPYALSIRVVLTDAAANFLAGQSAEQPDLAALAALPHVDGVYLDADEWAEPWARGQEILHIQLRRWADLMVVAPLSANSLAKLAAGLCDNLLLSTMRAWDTTGLLDPVRVGGGAEAAAAAVVAVQSGDGLQETARPRERKVIVVAPAMNTAMWLHPITQKHIRLLEEDWGVSNGGWIEVLRPIDKGLACGDVGVGGMREWKEIVTVIVERLKLQNSK